MCTHHMAIVQGHRPRAFSLPPTQPETGDVAGAAGCPWRPGPGVDRIAVGAGGLRLGQEERETYEVNGVDPTISVLRNKRRN